MELRHPVTQKTVVAFNQGDPSAFRQVFNGYYKSLYYFIRKLIAHNDEEAEDITLQTFQKLFARHQNFETAANIKAFLYITARNTCFNYLKYAKAISEKQRQFAEKMKNDTLLQYEYEIRDELIEKVRAAVDNLPPECQRVFKMLYYEELTPADVAEILQISVNTVYNQKSRAIKALRMALGDQYIAIGWLLLLLRMMPASVEN